MALALSYPPLSFGGPVSFPMMNRAPAMPMPTPATFDTRFDTAAAFPAAQLAAASAPMMAQSVHEQYFAHAPSAYRVDPALVVNGSPAMMNYQMAPVMSMPPGAHSAMGMPMVQTAHNGQGMVMYAMMPPFGGNPNMASAPQMASLATPAQMVTSAFPQSAVAQQQQQQQFLHQQQQQAQQSQFAMAVQANAANLSMQQMFQAIAHNHALQQQQGQELYARQQQQQYATVVSALAQEAAQRNAQKMRMEHDQNVLQQVQFSQQQSAHPQLTQAWVVPESTMAAVPASVVTSVSHSMPALTPDSQSLAQMAMAPVLKAGKRASRSRGPAQASVKRVKQPAAKKVTSKVAVATEVSSSVVDEEFAKKHTHILIPQPIRLPVAPYTAVPPQRASGSQPIITIGGKRV